MINGILAERTVSDVLPALQTNADGLKKVLDDLVKQYQSKQADLEKWKVGFFTFYSQATHADNEAEEEQYPGGSAIDVSSTVTAITVLRHLFNFHNARAHGLSLAL